LLRSRFDRRSLARDVAVQIPQASDDPAAQEADEQHENDAEDQLP